MQPGCGFYQSWSHQETDGILKIGVFIQQQKNDLGRVVGRKREKDSEIGGPGGNLLHTHTKEATPPIQQTLKTTEAAGHPHL